MSPAWVHDFAATDKYAVIIEHPLYMNLGSLLLDTPATHIFSECAGGVGTVCTRVLLQVVLIILRSACRRLWTVVGVGSLAQAVWRKANSCYTTSNIHI